MYAERVTDSMQAALDETERRREIQQEYNDEHGIVPETIVKRISDTFGTFYSRDYHDAAVAEAPLEFEEGELEKHLAGLEKEMLEAAEELDFERAGELRDQMQDLRRRQLGLR